MATSLSVHIVTPERKVFSGSASEVVLPAWEGETGVLPDHDPLLALLRAGTCTVASTEGAKVWVVGRGFAEIGPDAVTILTSTAVAPKDIDRAKAQKELDAAERSLMGAEVGTAAHAMAQIAVEQAQALLSA